jgi:hypothetical protein
MILGMAIQVQVSDTPDGYECEDDFLPVGDTRTRSESRRVRDGYFFHPRITRRVSDTLLPL